MSEFSTPQEALRHHVSGAVERGEKESIVGQPAGIDHAELQALLRGPNEHNVTFNAHWNTDRTGTVVYLRAGYIEVDASGSIFHVAGRTECLQVGTKTTEDAFHVVRLFAKQTETKDQIEDLLRVLEHDVPDGVAHYAVEGAKRSLRRLANTIHTVDFFYGR